MSLKTLIEGFNKRYKVEEAPIVEKFSLTEASKAMQDLAKALFAKLRQLENNYESNIKTFEIAFQDVIEKQFPGKSWWEVTDCNIFNSLFSGRDPERTVTEILKGVKPEYKEEITEDIGNGMTIEDMFKAVMGKDFVVFDRDGYFTKEAEKAYNTVAQRFGEDDFDELCNQEHCFRESIKEARTRYAKDTEDISDAEYKIGLERHIREIPKYSDDKLLKDYRDFKDSTHKDDKRVEAAIKREMEKRGLTDKTQDMYDESVNPYGDNLLHYSSELNDGGMLDTIVNAALKAATRDGYGQVVYFDTDDGKYYFHRDYPSYQSEPYQKVVGNVVLSYDGGIQRAKFVPCTDKYDESCKSKKCKEAVGSDVSEYQKWVDYDMKKYHKISNDTMKKIKSAGLSVVKDQYGDYEVIADRPVDESIDSFNETRSNYGHKGPFWYFTLHGVGPGSIPSGVKVIEVRDGVNRKGTQGTFVALDSVLTTDELKRFDLIELAPKDTMGESKSLSEKKWAYTLRNGANLRDAIDAEDTYGIIEELKKCYQELLDADIIDEYDFDTYVEDLDYLDPDDEDVVDEIDFQLGEFYDLCDNLDIWVSMNESVEDKDKDVIKIKDINKKVEWEKEDDSEVGDPSHPIQVGLRGRVNKLGGLKESADEKFVIYKQMGDYYVTPKSNYGGRFQNSRKVYKMDGHESAKEVIDYWVKYFGSKPEDFEVIDESAKTPYGDTTIEDYVRDNFGDSAKAKALANYVIKNKDSNKRFLNMSVDDWKALGQKFGLTMFAHPVTEAVDKNAFYDLVIKTKGNPSIKDLMSVGFSEGQAVEMISRMADFSADSFVKSAQKLKGESLSKKKSVTEAMLFKPMTKEEAKDFYDRIKSSEMDMKMKKIVLDDLNFFTNNFEKDYGKKIEESASLKEYVQYYPTFKSSYTLSSTYDDVEDAIIDAKANGYDTIVRESGRSITDTNPDIDIFSVEEAERFFEKRVDVKQFGKDEEAMLAFLKDHSDYDSGNGANGLFAFKVSNESLKHPQHITNESSDDEIKIYMNTWANYNENGADLSQYGINSIADGWMSIDDAIEFAEEHAEDEPFINDTENVPEAFGINEYSNAVESLNELKEFEEAGADMDIIEAIMDSGYSSIKDALDIYERGDYYWYPGVSNETDLAYAVIDEIGGLGEALGDRVSNYIDEDAMRRDYEYDVRDMMYDDAKSEVAREEDIDEDEVTEEQIEDWIDENIDSYLDSIIDDEVALAQNGEIDLSNYFDYEAFGRDLRYDGYTFTDAGCILVP